MPEACTLVRLTPHFVSPYDSVSLSIRIGLFSGQRVCVATYGGRCMLSMVPYQGMPCPPHRHSPCCMSLINNTLFNRSLVMNAYARLLGGVTSRCDALLDVRLKCDCELALMGYYHFDFKDSRAMHLRLPHFTRCPGLCRFQSLLSDSYLESNTDFENSLTIMRSRNA